MQNLFIIMLVLVGAAVALLIALITLQPQAPSEAGPPDSSQINEKALIPQEIAGFELDRIQRSDPIFEGELFSVHASFMPVAGSDFEGQVESLGLSLFLLKDPKSGEEIKQLLRLLGEPSEITVEGVKMDQLINEQTGSLGLIWQDQEKIYYIEVSQSLQSEVDMAVLREAALIAAKAILRGS